MKALLWRPPATACSTHSPRTSMVTEGWAGMRTAWVTGSVTAAVQARETGATVWRVSLMRPKFPFDVGSGVLFWRVWFTRRSFDHDWAALRPDAGALVVSSGAESGLVAGLGLGGAGTCTSAAWA